RRRCSTTSSCRSRRSGRVATSGPTTSPSTETQLLGARGRLDAVTTFRRPAPRHPAPAIVVLALTVVAFVAGAGSALGAASPSPSPAGSVGPAPSPGQTFSTGDLRFLLIDRFGPRWYCDPDEYPIAHGDEQSNADAHFPQLQKDAVLFGAILRHLGISPAPSFGPADRLAMYRLWKPAISLPLDPIGNGRYRFDYLAMPIGGANQGLRTAGTVSDTGDVVVEQQGPATGPNCPICLARGTRID